MMKNIYEVIIGLSGDYGLASRGSNRNTKAGIRFAQGGKLIEKELTEGVHSLPIILELAKKLKISLPITQLTQAILDGRITLNEAKTRLVKFGTLGVADFKAS